MAAEGTKSRSSDQSRRPRQPSEAHYRRLRDTGVTTERRWIERGARLLSSDAAGVMCGLWSERYRPTEPHKSARKEKIRFRAAISTNRRPSAPPHRNIAGLSRLVNKARAQRSQSTAHWVNHRGVTVYRSIHVTHRVEHQPRAFFQDPHERIQPQPDESQQKLNFEPVARKIRHRFPSPAGLQAKRKDIGDYF